MPASAAPSFTPKMLSILHHSQAHNSSSLLINTSFVASIMTAILVWERKKEKEKEEEARMAMAAIWMMAVSVDDMGN
jgi:hypothetical protein